MRGDVVFRVYGVHEGRAGDSFFGAFRTRAEAETRVAELIVREMHGENWAARYHDQGFVIRESIVETDFEVPSLPKPRDEWAVRTSEVSNGPGVWASTKVEVCRRGDDGLEPVASYLRNLALFQTFEPFRQGGRAYALISRDYEATAVLDLESGEVIAEEEGDEVGFCPVGFYVPDWWDVHDGSIIPGSEFWTADKEWPRGDFGFVWGCHWGDDSSWKVQHLDLSRLSEGVITRRESFGYIQLASTAWERPWLDLDRKRTDARSDPPAFLRVSRYSGQPRVRIAVELDFDLRSGAINPQQLQCLLRTEAGPE